VLAVLKAYEPSGLRGVFTDRRPPAEIRFGVGDLVGVTIFEAAAGGLFIPPDAGARAGNFVNIPDQAVDRNGNIQVPYAGSIPAANRTPSQVQADIQARLQNRAIEPQVVVTLKEQRTSLVSVLGEVNAPTRLPVTAAGDRVLDAISRAGGPKNQGFETYVTLQRGDKKASVSFLRLLNEPANNIFIRPGDTVFLYREPHTFLAFGASGRNGQFPFEKEKLTLAEAVARASGLLDERADPTSVFLFRLEPRKVAEAIGADPTKKVEYVMPAVYNVRPDDMVPVIYNVNLREPVGYFHATNFRMRNYDVLFVSNASSVEVLKVLQFVRIAISTVREGNFAVNELQCRGAVGPACNVVP
jgi:polysaccharide export outer membrane protein